MGPIKVRTLAQFHAVVSSGSGLVITDAARPAAFHCDPEGCAHVKADYFNTKVIENGERNGSYFTVPSLAAARQEWPDVQPCGSAACSSFAEAGAERDASPLEAALRAATGSSTVRPRRREPVGAEVAPAGWASTQRLALGHSEGGLVLRTWPAELKAQAAAFYAGDRARRLLALLSGTKWEAIPLPHLAFNGSQPDDRFYFSCPLDTEQYISFWSQPANLAHAGGHPLESIEPELWPWLCENQLADPTAPDARAELDRFVRRLRQRRAAAHLRPSIQVTRAWDPGLEGDPAALAREVRAAVREITGALREGPPSSVE